MHAFEHNNAIGQPNTDSEKFRETAVFELGAPAPEPDDIPIPMCNRDSIGQKSLEFLKNLPGFKPPGHAKLLRDFYLPHSFY